jgi:hypothetical protein
MSPDVQRPSTGQPCVLCGWPAQRTKGKNMDDKQLNKAIGYALSAIIAYYLLQVLIPFLIYGLVIWIAWRIFTEYKKHNK